LIENNKGEEQQWSDGAILASGRTMTCLLRRKKMIKRRPKFLQVPLAFTSLDLSSLFAVQIATQTHDFLDEGYITSYIILYNHAMVLPMLPRKVLCLSRCLEETFN